MAEWNKNKVSPSAINGGQEFINGDNLAVNELNAIVNNSFYSLEKAERAEKLSESAVKGNGSLVTIGGQIQGEWSADFAEAERQKSKNLFDGQFRQGNNVDYNVTNRICAVSHIYLQAGSTYTFHTNLDMTLFDFVIFIHDSLTSTLHTDMFGWYSSLNTASFSPTINGYFYIVIAFKDRTKNILPSDVSSYWWQLEEGTQATSYQPYNGAIVHEKDLVNVENVVLLYDKDSTDPNINQGKTRGVMFVNVNDDNWVSMGSGAHKKYKGFNVYIWAYGECLRCYVWNEDKTNNNIANRGATSAYDQAVGSGAIVTAGLNYQYNRMYAVVCHGVRTGGNTVDYRQNSNYYITKVEGVY